MLDIDKLSEQGEGQRPNCINYSTFWKTILNKCFDCELMIFLCWLIFTLWTEKYLFNDQFLICTTSHVWSKMICYKSKLFSLHVLELIQNILLQGRVMGKRIWHHWKISLTCHRTEQIHSWAWLLTPAFHAFQSTCLPIHLTFAK